MNPIDFIAHTSFDTLILLGSSIFITLVFFVWQITSADKFDLRYALLDKSDDKVSLQKLGQAIAMLTSTWVIVYETRAGRLTEYLILIYILTWAGSTALSKYFDMKAANFTQVTTK